MSIAPPSATMVCPVIHPASEAHSAARPPLQVRDQRGPELRVGGKPDVVRGLQQETHPGLPLLVGEMPVQMLRDHVRMPATVLRVVVRPAEHFGEELRDEAWMIASMCAKIGPSTS
jgi:hypothetical protein